MSDYSKDFALVSGHTWLNAASEGPLPKIAAEALQESLLWKMSPHLLTIPKFHQVPIDLKKTIARLIHASPEDIILGNSTTYGLHLLSNGLPLKLGDEVLLMQNDFPSDILPWLHLQNKGIQVRQLKGAGAILTPDEIKKALTPRTKVLCLPYIHSFSGWKLDIIEIGQLCRQYGILFIVNMAQAVGALDVNLERLPVDAVVCAGYKWMLGPYSTGFCWMRSEIREQLDYPQAYWVSLMDERSLNETGEIQLPVDRSSKRYDVFATANFFNYVPWKASIDYLLNIGMEQVNRHNDGLVDRIMKGMDYSRFDCLTPAEKDARTNIVVFSGKDQRGNVRIAEFLKDRGLYIAFWKGNLRISPHIYNTEGDVKRFLSVLNSYEPK